MYALAHYYFMLASSSPSIRMTESQGDITGFACTFALGTRRFYEVYVLSIYDIRPGLIDGNKRVVTSRAAP